MASLEYLNKLLTESSESLDVAAREIRDLQLNPEQNIKVIGEILMKIFEIRLQIYKQRPDLAPDYLKGKGE